MSERIEYCLEPFVEALKSFGMNPNRAQIRMFIQYYEMLIKWNQSVNLTAITEFDEVMLKHFIDSASFGVLKEPTAGKKLIDVGTGAGFPGIPLKILFPELDVTLIDSLQKRITFLNAVIEQLGLNEIKALHLRAEEAGHQPEYRESFDYCVSRAVANLAVLSEYCIPFVKVGGLFVSYKAADCSKELDEAGTALSHLSAEISNTKDVLLRYKAEQIKRRLVVIRKTAPTQEKYPRKAGIPAKRPLR